MYTKDWMEIAECSCCQHHITWWDSRFKDICSECGEYIQRSSSWYTKWRHRTVRFISHSIWWKPKTWGSGVIEFKDGEEWKVKKDKIVK